MLEVATVAPEEAGNRGRARVLFVDAGINLALGVVLLLSRWLADPLGIPVPETGFYPTILGGVLLGVGVALVMEARRRPTGLVGLGLGGAIAINLCGGVILAAWLIAGDLHLPLRGSLLLWGLILMLVGVSTVELLAFNQSSSRDGRA